MLAILSAPGSRGDVNPMVAIGRELRQRGFDVLIAMSQPYVEVARAAGLTAHPIIDKEQFDQMLGDPAVWKTVRGARAVLRAMSQHFVMPHHELIRQHHRPGETILVSHPLDFASRVIHESDPATPVFDVHLQPVLLRNMHQPPRMTPWWFEPSGPAWLLRSLFWAADHFGLDPVIRPAVNQLRNQYGLPPVRRIMNDYWLSPHRIIAMYPQWFAPSTSVFAPRLQYAGFPLQDNDDQPFTPPPDRPVVFTAGTAHHHCKQFFIQAAKTCRELNQPGILLTSYQQNIPDDLPANVRACSYVSLSELLPHCQAIVHHGGIGTTSQAFAASIPQVVRPMAFDQFDNATRVRDLGCGVWLKNDRGLTDAVRQVTSDTDIQNSCIAIGKKSINGSETQSGVTKAIDIIMNDLSTMNV